MEKKTILSVNQYTKVLVPASSYKLEEDPRLLLPFTSGDKIGFVDKNGIIIVEPQYDMYYGDCYSKEDKIRVAVEDIYGFIRSGGNVACYRRLLYGLINSKGEVILEPSFRHLIPAIGNKELYTVQNTESQYGVLRIDGSVVVPFGKYNWIDGFDKGLARVKTGGVINGINKSKWGLIDEKGEVVLPVEYDAIWTFYGKERNSTNVVKGGFSQNMDFSSILGRDKAYEKKSDSYKSEYEGNEQDDSII